MNIEKYFAKPDEFKTGKLIEKFKLFDDTYLFRFEKKLIIAKTNAAGEIVRVSIFGNKEV
jgi:hypothetical protein